MFLFSGTIFDFRDFCDYRSKQKGHLKRHIKLKHKFIEIDILLRYVGNVAKKHGLIKAIKMITLTSNFDLLNSVNDIKSDFLKEPRGCPVKDCNYNTKNQTFEHHIIKPFEKQWADSRQKYREYYNFILPLYEIVEIYSRKGGKGRKKVRDYVVCYNTESESGIKKISKRKAYKKAINNSQKSWF